MRVVFAIAALATLYIAYSVGYSRGLKNGPAVVEAKKERWAQIDQDIAFLESLPSTREGTCDAVFDLVKGELEREALEGQEAHSQISTGARD